MYMYMYIYVYVYVYIYLYVCIGVEMSEDQQKLYRKLKQVRDVFEYSPISGINRKLQMKPQKWVEIEGDTADTADKEKEKEKEKEKSKDKGKDKVGGTEGGNKKEKATEILLIVKWGGDLTPLGREQAENLGI